MSLENTMLLERLERQLSSNQEIYISRFYNGDQDLAGICLLDPKAGLDMSFLKRGVKQVLSEAGGTSIDAPFKGDNYQSITQRQAPSENFCQVTVEERTQLFGFMKKG